MAEEAVRALVNDGELQVEAGDRDSTSFADETRRDELAMAGAREVRDLTDPFQAARKLSPLRRATAFARRATELAEHAEWEAGAARQAHRSGNELLAHDALARAMRHVAGAQFLLALMGAALEAQSARTGRTVEPPRNVQLLATRARTAVAVAQAANDTVDQQLSGGAD